MGVGVPTVSYDYEVTEELRETGAGVLVSDSPRAFAETVARARRRPIDERHALAETAGAGRPCERELGRARPPLRRGGPQPLPALKGLRRFARLAMGPTIRRVLETSARSRSSSGPPEIRHRAGTGFLANYPASAMRVARNLGSSYILYGAAVLSGLILTPVIINAVGKEGYGVWLFIGSVTILLRLLDLGITPTVVRFTAYHRGQDAAGGGRRARVDEPHGVPGAREVVSIAVGLVIAWFLPGYDLSRAARLERPAQAAAVIAGHHARHPGAARPLLRASSRGRSGSTCSTPAGSLSIGVYAVSCSSY